MKYITFFALVLTLACNRNDFEPIKEPTVINLLDRYHLKQLKPDQAVMQNALFGRRIYSEVKDELDFNNVERFKSFEDQSSVYIFGFKDNPNKKYAVKVLVSEKMLLVKNEILYSRQMKDQNNGSIGIMKDEETLRINFKNGVSTIDEMDQTDYRIQFTKMGFCQRESTQTFKQCYLKEVDEFCDSFISCVALATNPTVSVLIAAACSCDA